MVGKTVTIMFQEYWKINVCVLDLTMLSCCYIGKIVVGVLPNATEDQRVGRELVAKLRMLVSDRFSRTKIF